MDIDDEAMRDHPSLAAAEDEDHSDVRAAIMALDEEYREPLVLQVLLGYSTEEIAAHLGINPGAVLTRLYRARQKLRAAIAGAGRQ